MSAVAKPSLLTLPPAVYKDIFKYVRPWYGLRCVRACTSILEHRQKIIELWQKWKELAAKMYNTQNVSKLKKGALLVWRHATVTSRPGVRREPLSEWNDRQWNQLIGNVFEGWQVPGNYWSTSPGLCVCNEYLSSYSETGSSFPLNWYIYRNAPIRFPRVTWSVRA